MVVSLLLHACQGECGGEDVTFAASGRHEYGVEDLGWDEVLVWNKDMDKE